MQGVLIWCVCAQYASVFATSHSETAQLRWNAKHVYVWRSRRAIPNNNNKVFVCLMWDCWVVADDGLGYRQGVCTCLIKLNLHNLNVETHTKLKPLVVRLLMVRGAENVSKDCATSKHYADQRLDGGGRLSISVKRAPQRTMCDR